MFEDDRDVDSTAIVPDCVEREGAAAEQSAGPDASNEDILSRFQDVLENGTPEERIQALENLQRARNTTTCMEARLAYQIERDVIRANQDRGAYLNCPNRSAAAMVQIARHRTQSGGQSFLKNCHILIEDMPYLLSQYELGLFTEEQVMTITTNLQDESPEDRRLFDKVLQRFPAMFTGCGLHKISQTVKKFTLRRQSHLKAKQVHRACKQRYVRFRRGKDCVMVTAKLPIIEGEYLRADLTSRVEALRRQGDRRTKEQLMADQLTVRTVMCPVNKLPVPVSLKLVMTDKALFRGDREPARLPWYGLMPAQIGRELVAGHYALQPDPDESVDFSSSSARARNFFDELASEQSRLDTESLPVRDDLSNRIDVRAEIQRVFTAPGGQDVITMESKARILSKAAREFIGLRDIHCATPYCDNEPSVVDHVYQFALGGPTSVENSEFRCQHCNLAKESAGWKEKITSLLPRTLQVELGNAVFESITPPAAGYVREIRVDSEDQ